MTDSISSTTLRTPECLPFEQQLADYLEGSLTTSERAIMNEHRRHCPTCNALVCDIAGLVEQASALPVLTPSRDLWSGIESQLDTTVIPLSGRSTAITDTVAPRRSVSMRTFAVAAALLVAVTAGVTWRVARVQTPRGRAVQELAVNNAPSVPSANVMRLDDSTTVAESRSTSTQARLVAASPADVDDIYEREITSLRRVVNERFADLDSTTVFELRRNLAIIDAAIADSRRALKLDPRSRLLSTQLDRALETKLALMRRVALL